MSAGANPTRFYGAGRAALVLWTAFSCQAWAGIGPEPDPPPRPASEARPIGPSHPVEHAPAEADSAARPAGGWILRTALALGGVVALILISGAITRAVARGRGGLAGAFGPGGRAPSGVISVLGRYPISRGQKLVLLHIDRRVLVVCQSAGGRLGTGGGMTALCEITEPEEVASILMKARDAEGESMSERFRSMLGAVDRHFRPSDPAADHGSRRMLGGGSGDRAELWDDRTIEYHAPAEFPAKQPGPPERDAVGSLRRRLEALRSGDSSLEAPA